MFLQDVSILVYQALNADTALLALLGGKIPLKQYNRVYNSQKAPIAEELPRVTMHEILNDDDIGADDTFHCSNIEFRIDVWDITNKNMFAICKRIKEVLKSLTSFSCRVKLQSMMYEQDTQVYHRPINVNILIKQ